VQLNSFDAVKWKSNRWARYPVPYSCTNCTPNPVIHTLPASPPNEWGNCLDGHRIYAGTSKVPAPTAAALFEPPTVTPFAQSYFQPRYSYSYRCLDASERPAGSIHKCGHMSQYYGGQNSRQGCFSSELTMYPLSMGRTAIERADVRKAIVLLTDGEDSCCWLGKPGCSNSPMAVSRAEACTAAKSRGTEIFVIAAMMPSQISGAFKQSLEACSSESDNEHPQGTRRPGMNYVFLINSTVDDIEAAFVKVAKRLRTLRKAL